jgi:hypothetical protein
MIGKLNLSIDEKLVKKIKIYAQKKHLSVSRLIEKLIKDEMGSDYKTNNFSDTYAASFSGELSEKKVKERLAFKFNLKSKS